MRVEGDWLAAPPTQAVMEMLEAGGHRALAVGGCVRNALLGEPVTDIDIATDARPDRVTELAVAAGLKAVPTGIDHGTITVVADGIPHEVTTFRRDVETDGRHAIVAFSDDPATDAARRDFTMNALYADARGTVLDPLGGLSDLCARHVRFIGDPDARIAEDHLRILRFFRFTARYGDPDLGIDAEGLAACATTQEGLDALSSERITQEVTKLLDAPDPVAAVAAMARTGILGRLLPGADAAPLGPLVHAAPWADRLARLAAMGGDTGRLRLPKAEAKVLAALTAAARDGDPPFAIGDELGSRGVDAIAVRAALLGQAPDLADLALARAGAAATFPLRAADLMPTLSGPELGAGLARARATWRAARGEIDRAALIAVATG